MDQTIVKYLNPDLFQIDDRKTDDFILYSLAIAKSYKYFNLENKHISDWSELLKNDDSFLLARIAGFDLLYYDKLRLNFIKDFDGFSSEREKETIFSGFFTLVQSLFTITNNWYVSARKNNIKNEPSKIELELENAIAYNLKPYFHELFGYYQYLKNTDELHFDAHLDINDFDSIWKVDGAVPINIFDTVDETQEPLASALKKIIIIFNPVYKLLYSIKIKSNSFFNASLQENDNHKAHVGLLLAFIHLYDYARNDLNEISKQHLNFYYRSILKQTPLLIEPKKMYLTVEIDENAEGLNLDVGKEILAGQDEDGNEIRYKTDEAVQLNNAKISHLSTHFVSRNINFDFSSRFKLVSGVFHKTHCGTVEEVEEFNESQATFSTLGEDQTFKTSQYQTMENSQISFALGSPVLVLSKSERKITFKFEFSPDAINYLSNLILDIASNRGLSEESVFDNIFSNAFTILYTHEEDWVTVKEYQVLYPQDWSTGEIEIVLQLSKKFPSIDVYNEADHQMELHAQTPLFLFKLNNDNFYYVYSFLYEMELTKIDIEVEVKKLNSLTVINDLGEVDSVSEFSILGDTPKVGSSFFIGHHELFCKKIDTISFGWEYTNLPGEHPNLASYYKEYQRDIKDQDFQLEIAALSDHNYDRGSSKKEVIEMFDMDDAGQYLPFKNIVDINLEKFNIEPNYKLNAEAIENFDANLETGYFKFTLLSPKVGFGFDVFSKIYDEVSDQEQKLALKNKKPSENVPYPNEPYAPMAQAPYVDYKASTSLFFEQTRTSENDYDQDNAFFLLSSNGTQRTLSKEGVSSTHIVPQFPYEGEMVIGLQNVAPPQYLNVLVEIQKSQSTNYKFSHKMEWQYLSFNGWKTFEPDEIINDSTLNLIRTGIIVFRIPKDIDDNPGLFDVEHVAFIKACSKSKADQLSLVKAIWVNAISATEIITDKFIKETEELPKGAAESFEEAIEGVVSINQPLPSFGGSSQERELDFFYRVSELLRHKNRPVTKRDIEKFTLIRFPWLSYVRCFTADEKTSEDANVRLLCMKKIKKGQNIEEVKLSQADFYEIKSFIRQFASPFVSIEVVNPIFEDLWIKANIKFIDISGGAGVEKLNQELFYFLCPWVKENTAQIQLASRIRKSEILNFVKKLPFVDFVTGFSVIHIKTTEEGMKIAFDTALNEKNAETIQIGTSKSILVPRESHITIIDNKEYAPPEQMNFTDLRVEDDFIVTSDQAISEFENAFGKSNEEKKENNPVVFSIKI